MTEETREAARRFAVKELARLGKGRAEVARDAKVDPKTLRAFLTGTRWPRQDKRTAISVALGWPPDEIDHIERTGEHRINIRYIDAHGGETLRPRTTTMTSRELTELWLGAVSFATFVMDKVPALTERANALIETATQLWSDANQASLSEPSDTPDLSVAAHEEDTSITAEQEEPTEP